MNGVTKRRRLDVSEERGYDNHPLLNSVFTKMAKIFMKHELGTEEEAYVCILPAFRDKMPHWGYAADEDAVELHEEPGIGLAVDLELRGSAHL